MNYHDFIDTIIDTCKETKNRPFEGMRSQHLKMFAHCYGAEFTNIMSRLDFKPEFIQKNLHAMRQGKSDNIFDLHHKTNITNFRELPNPHQINDFSNMLITFAYPHHRCMHFDKGFDIDKSVVFLGSFDPAFQIRRNIEREQRYLTMKTAAHAKSR